MILLLVAIIMICTVIENERTNERTRRKFAEMHDEWIVKSNAWRRDFELGKDVGPPPPPPPSCV